MKIVCRVVRKCDLIFVLVRIRDKLIGKWVEEEYAVMSLLSILMNLIDVPFSNVVDCYVKILLLYTLFVFHHSIEPCFSYYLSVFCFHFTLCYRSAAPCYANIESQSEDDWDESFATTNEILAKAKSSGVLSLNGSSMKRNNENDSHDFENNDHFERKGISIQQRPSSGNANTIMREGKKWNNEEMSDIRLRQIKQYVSKSKKESRDETSFSEDDSQEDYDGNEERKVEKGVRQSHYGESKQKPPRERSVR